MDILKGRHDTQYNDIIMLSAVMLNVVILITNNITNNIVVRVNVIMLSVAVAFEGLC